SQDGIDVKDNVKGSKSRSQSMKEQTYNKEQRERPRPHELNDKSNLIDLMKELLTGSYNAFTFGDQFLNDKSPKEEPGKANVETEVESMVTIPIHQASSSVPPLSTTIIDLTPPKLVSPLAQEPIFTATTTTTSTTLPLPPPPRQQSTTDPDQTNSPIHERFRDLSAIKMKEILHDRMFESGSYRSHPEHTALYDALELSIDHENREEFNEATAKSRKRCCDDQDPPTPPPKGSNESKKKRNDSDASASKQPLVPSSNGIANRLESKLVKGDLEGPAYKLVKPFHKNSISLQFQMEECHSLLTDHINLMNPKRNWVVHDINKPLPLGGPPGDNERRNALSISKLKAAYYPNFGLEELVPSLWIKSERDYDISTAYGISHWWFKRKEFYIRRHSAPSNRSAVRSHMRILSVISHNTYSRYGYTFLKEIVLRRADYKEYKISEADFKNMHPNDFEDMYLLHLQGKLNHLFGAKKSYQTKLNLTLPRWDATDFLFKEYYTIVHKPKAVIYRDRSNQKKLIRETQVHKFSDGTLTGILEKLDFMVKDYELFKLKPGMGHRVWSEDDKRRSQEFIKLIERRLKIRRIFKSLESFVSRSNTPRTLIPLRPNLDDDEDPEEDPVDYPADGGDDGDDEDEPSEEDKDDGVDIEVDEDEEEEHPALANSVVVALPVTDHAPSAEETEPFETDESTATLPPYPAYRVTTRISIPAQVPTPVWSDVEVARLLAISTPPSLLLSPWSSPLPQIPSPPLPPIPSPSLPVSPPLPVSSPVPVLSPSPPPSPIQDTTTLCPSSDSYCSSPPLLLPSASRREDRPRLPLPTLEEDSYHSRSKIRGRKRAYLWLQLRPSGGLISRLTSLLPLWNMEIKA
ncbi:hypothetical protein Tco_0630073, partial [Tanacetum coccineum]